MSMFHVHLSEDHPDRRFRFVVVRTPKGGHLHGRLHRDGRTLYHGFFVGLAPTHTTLDAVDIIKDYGTHDVDDWDTIEQIERQFYDDFPPRSGVEASGGWLAPDGRYFPCKYGAHSGLAYDLCVWLGLDDGSHYSRDRVLEEHGWLRVYDDYATLPQRGHHLTEAQKSTLRKLLDVVQDAKFRQSIINVLEYEDATA